MRALLVILSVAFIFIALLLVFSYGEEISTKQEVKTEKNAVYVYSKEGKPIQQNVPTEEVKVSMKEIDSVTANLNLPFTIYNAALSPYGNVTGQLRYHPPRDTVKRSSL